MLSLLYVLISGIALPVGGIQMQYLWRNQLGDVYSLGLGSAACGFLGNIRYQNPPALSDYLAHCPAQETVLSPEDAQFESVMLGLRMTEGVSEEAFLRMHGVSLQSVYGEKLKKPLAQGLVEWKDGFLRLTRRGMDVQNSVLVELL